MLGSLILVVSLVMVPVYFYLVFMSPWRLLVVRLSAFLAVAVGLLFMAWVGYTLAATPTPSPLEDLDLEELPEWDEDEARAG